MQWSYTRLRDFETCPRLFAAKYVAKTVKEPPTEQQLWGTRVHKALEQRAAGVPLPDELKHLEHLGALIDHARQGGIQVFADEASGQWAFDKDLRPVADWFGKEVWVRVVVDLALVGKTHAVVVDYKTGKRREDPLQLALFGAATFAKFPAVSTVDTTYVFTQGFDAIRARYERKDVPALWQEILPQVERMETAVATGQLGPRPNGLCRQHCPNTQCEFNGRRDSV